MRGVLFDLDGTLLDIDLPAFLDRYFDALTQWSSPLLAETRTTPEEFLHAIRSGTRAMMSPHAGRTNREVFHDALLSCIGLDLDAAWPVYERFYREIFPRLGESARPMPGAREAVETALGLGLKVVVATNPIFPLVAVQARLAWAGLGDIPFAGITSYEQMTACKPHLAYFREAAALAGLAPHECIMVGDDRYLDMPASDVGMRTFYVGEPTDGGWVDLHGDLTGFADLLPRLVTASDG